MVLVCPPCPKVSLEKLNKRASFSKYLVRHALRTRGSVASINRTTVTMNFSRSLPLTLIFHSYCSPLKIWLAKTSLHGALHSLKFDHRT